MSFTLSSILALNLINVSALSALMSMIKQAEDIKKKIKEEHQSLWDCFINKNAKHWL